MIVCVLWPLSHGAVGWLWYFLDILTYFLLYLNRLRVREIFLSPSTNRLIRPALPNDLVLCELLCTLLFRQYSTILQRWSTNDPIEMGIILKLCWAKYWPRPNSYPGVSMAHVDSNYSSYLSNYSSIRTSIVATLVLLDINGGSEHRYSSTLSGSLL